MARPDIFLNEIGSYQRQTDVEPTRVKGIVTIHEDGGTGNLSIAILDDQGRYHKIHRFFPKALINRKVIMDVNGGRDRMLISISLAD